MTGDAAASKGLPAEILVGGQAVPEGVMMKLPRSWAVTVRRSDGSFVSQSGDVVPWSERWPILKLPILRGPAVLGQMMGLGMRSLFFASDVVAGDDPPKSKGPIASALSLAASMLWLAVADGPDGTEGDGASQGPDLVAPGLVRGRPVNATGEPAKGMSASALTLSILFAVVLFVVVFKAIPLGIAYGLGALFPALKSHVAESIVSGLALATVVIGYLFVLSRFEDMKRLFAYHGAEHELVHVHEKGLPWTPANAREQSTRHPRCGTSFIVFVVLTSIVVWTIIPAPATFLAKIGLRLLLLPVVMGLAFELIRFSARHRTNPITRALMAPGLWTQSITTRKPDDSMREVSIRSLELASSRASA